MGEIVRERQESRCFGGISSLFKAYLDLFSLNARRMQLACQLASSQVHLRASEAREALSSAQQAVALATCGEDQATAAAQLCMVRWSMGEMPQALEALERLLETLKRWGRGVEGMVDVSYFVYIYRIYLELRTLKNSWALRVSLENGDQLTWSLRNCGS